MLISWKEFIKGKTKNHDVEEFSLSLMDSILKLHSELLRKTYQHGGYHFFKINDPKPRDIHKASVRDRLLHHAIYRSLYPYFDRKFIHDSYSCRIDKGTHRAINRLRYFSRKVSKNYSRDAWVLKCDIRKFFTSIDHKVLKEILHHHINDQDILWLLSNVIDSFHSGLPLGNLTSQLFINIYMNEFDQYVKRKLKIRYYLRYADDFIILSENKTYLLKLISKLEHFLLKRLKLELHPKKISLKRIDKGMDFLGWINFPHHRVLRTSTKRRMFKKLKENRSGETIASYSGLLIHGNTYKLIQKIRKQIIDETLYGS